MPSTRMRWVALTGFGAVLLGSSVLAQPGPGEPPDALATVRQGSQLSAQEQVSQADLYLSRMKEGQDRVAKLAERARNEKDIIKLNCVNDKLTHIKGNINVAEELRSSLQAMPDPDARSHQFAKLTITYQKVVVLEQEAEACIGEEVAYVGTTRLEVEVDEEIPVEDPTEEPDPPLPVVRPPLASPFL